MKFYFVLLFFVPIFAQYDESPIRSPPAHMPTVKQVDSRLRAPPIPTWVDRLNQEKNEVLSDEVIGSGVIQEPEEGESGDHSGDPEMDGSGGSGRRPTSEASGEGSGPDDFDKMMSIMDKQAIAAGVTCISDIIFVLDATSSVKGIFEEYIKYILKVIEGLDISSSNDHVGVIVYSSERKQKEKIQLGQFNLTSNLQQAVRELPFFSGITATGEALKFASEHTTNRRSNLTLNYVVLTDGYSYDIIESGARKLRAVPRSTIYAVSIGEAFVKSELEIITSNPENVFHGENSYGALVKSIKSCHSNSAFQRDSQAETVTVRYIPTPIDSQGRHLVPNPKFTKNGVQVFNDKATKEQIEHAARESIRRNDRFIVAPTTEVSLLTTDCDYDIGLIFDASGSLSQSFQKQLVLADKLIDQLPISKNHTRVAVVQFAGKTKTKVLTDFEDKTTKDEVRKVIKFSHFYSGTTFTNQALLKMANLFKNSNRDNAKRKMIIFTDGYSAEDTSIGIEKLKSQGVTIYTVGCSTNGIGVNINELENMASSPEYYYESSHFDELLQHFPTTKYC